MSEPDFTPQKLLCTRGPDLHFDGRLVGSYTTQNKAGTKPRWTELRLWETRGGNFIAENAGMSAQSGEGTIREAQVLSGVGREGMVSIRSVDLREPGAFDRLTEIDDASSPSQPQRLHAMEVWAWSTAAKAFARDLGWEMAVRVD